MSHKLSLRSRSIGTVLAAVLFILGATAGPIAFTASAHDAGLEVDITETNSPIVEGERLEVTVNVSNAGEHTHTEEISLSVGGEVRDTRTVRVSGGQNRTITLEWLTETGDRGDYEATVSSANDANSTTVSVGDPGPWYTVEIAGTNAPVVEGETLRVNATVQNIDEQTGNQTMELIVGGEVRDATNVSLEGGEETTVSFTWRTADGDAGTYDVAVDGNHETARTSIDVLAAANLSVINVSSNSPVVEGDRLTVTATVQNTGGVAGQEAVSLQVGGTVNGTVVNVSAGETKRVTLSWATQRGDVGTYVASITVGDTTRQTAAAVLAPQTFAITSLQTNAPVEEGDPVEVTAIVQNVGDLPGNQTVTFAVDGEIQNTTTVYLGQGENTTVSLTWESAPGDAGTHTVTVATANSSASQEFVVDEPEPTTTEPTNPPTASIQYLVGGSTPDTVPAETPVTFEADAEDSDGTIESYEWRIDGETVSSTASFEYTFESAGTYEVQLVVTDDAGATATAVRTIEVSAPEPTMTRTTTAEPTQTTAYAPGLGVLPAVIAIAVVGVGLWVRRLA